MSRRTPPHVLWPDILRPYAPVTKPQPVPISAPFDEPCECLFVNAEWRGYLVGALEVLDQVDAWDGTDEEIQTARDGVTEIIACLIGGDMSCLSEMTDRLDALALCCQQQSLAGDAGVATYRLQLQDLYDGTPTSIDPDAPEDTWTETTGDSGAKIAEREAALCRAIDRYLRTLANDIKMGLLLASGVGGLGAGLLGLANPVLGIFAGAAIFIAQGMGDYVWDDEVALQKNACCMYASLEGAGTIDFATFQASLDDCSFTPVTTEEWQRAALNGSNQDESNYLAFLSALGSDTRLASIYEMDTLDCECAYEWSHTLDLMVSDDDTVPVTNIYDGDEFMAYYTAGQGYGPGDMHDGGTNYQRICQVWVDFPSSANVKSIRIFYDGEIGTYDAPATNDDSQDIWGLLATVKTYDPANRPFQEGVGKQAVYTLDQTLDQLKLYLRTCARATTAVWDGQVRLYKIIVSGDGADPWA